MIEKIIVPTLERRLDRRYINLGALVTMGVPCSLIEYFPARDGQAYEGDAARAVEEAQREGWRLSPEMAESYSQQYVPGSLKWFCMRWTFTMIFQQIMNAPADTYYMFLLDDFGLKRPFKEFLHLLRFVTSDAKHLGSSASIIQLDVWDLLDCPRVEREPIGSIASKVVVRGLSGAGDAGFILNNEGARILYERMCETGGAWNMEGQIWRMAQEEDQSGFYSVAPPRYMIDIIPVSSSALA